MLSRWRKKKDRLQSADPRDRQAAVAALTAEQSSEFGAKLATMAASDPDEAVRAVCVRKLSDPTLLRQLLDQAATAPLAARRIAELAATDDNLERWPLAHALVLPLALEQLPPERAQASLSSVTDPELLVRACLQTRGVLRESILPRLQTASALGLLERQSRGHDKSLNRHARQALDRLKTLRAGAAASQQRVEELLQAAERHRADEIRHQLALRRQLDDNLAELTGIHTELTAFSEPVAKLAELEQRAAQLPRIAATAPPPEAAAVEPDPFADLTAALRVLDEELIAGADWASIERRHQALTAQWLQAADRQQPGVDQHQVFESVSHRFQELNRAWHAAEAALAEAPQEAAIPQALPEASQDMAPLLAQLPKRRLRLRNLQQQIEQVGWPAWAQPRAAFETLQQLATTLTNDVERLGTAQDKLTKQLGELLDTLNIAVEAGAVADASKLLGQTRRVCQALPEASINDLQHRLNSLAARVAELRDWQNFATSPKREALCAAIRQLADEPLAPPQQAERIKALRAEWNALGTATNQQDRTLADDFNRLAQSAFEPCREYFAEQAETRAKNLQARRDICAQLRGYLQSTDWRSADIKAAEQIMRTARSEWLSYHPVDRKAGKAVDAEFEQLQDELHRHVKAAWDANLERKREIVTEAEALATGDQEIAAKIDAAKALQRRWREVGATPRKPDQKLWQQFRSACDAVFGQRDAARADADAATRAAQQACQALLAELRETVESTSVTEASKDFVRQARSRFAKLPQLPPQAFRSSQREFDELLARYQTLLAQQGTQAQLDTLRSLRAADEAVARFEAQRAAGGSDSLEAPAACFVQRLQQPGPAPDLQALSAAAIRAELLAGVESPTSDQELRLQIQVEQLNAGMSRERATPSVMQLAEQWCALGPKYWGSDPDSGARCDALRARLFEALERALGTSQA